MTYEQCKERYLNDNEFHQVVNMFYRLKFQNKLTTVELKDALLFACIKFEEENIRPIIINKNDEMKFV